MDRLSVLVADDEGMIALDLGEALTEAGFDVSVTFHGRQAIKLLEAGELHFQALVTDIRMGDGPDGWDVAHRARELNPSIPVVYVSADSAEEWPVYGVPNSIMIAKPFVAAQVVTAVTMLLNAAGPRGSQTA